MYILIICIIYMLYFNYICYIFFLICMYFNVYVFLIHTCFLSLQKIFIYKIIDNILFSVL